MGGDGIEPPTSCLYLPRPRIAAQGYSRQMRQRPAYRRSRCGMRRCPRRERRARADHQLGSTGGLFRRSANHTSQQAKAVPLGITRRELFKRLHGRSGNALGSHSYFRTWKICIVYPVNGNRRQVHRWFRISGRVGIHRSVIEDRETGVRQKPPDHSPGFGPLNDKRTSRSRRTAASSATGRRPGAGSRSATESIGTATSPEFPSQRRSS